MMKMIEFTDKSIKQEYIRKRKHDKERSRRCIKDPSLTSKDKNCNFWKKKKHKNWMTLATDLTPWKEKLTERFGNRNYSK